MIAMLSDIFRYNSMNSVAYDPLPLIVLDRAALHDSDNDGGELFSECVHA